MPTFDFACQKCTHVFEYTRPFGSTIKPACPLCKSKRVEKLFSAPAIVFKGEGWYKTEGRAMPKKESPAATESHSIADKKSETGAADTPSNAVKKPTSKAEKKASTKAKDGV